MECISRAGADEVHDLLPEKYRNMLGPWPDAKIEHYKPYTFPAPGQGSGFERPIALKIVIVPLNTDVRDQPSFSHRRS